MAIVTTITVTSAGTRVQSPRQGTIRALTISARPSNANWVYVGGADVTSTIGIELAPGDSRSFVFQGSERLEHFYADAAASGDAVDLMGDNT